jgi:hypothetical protein
LASTSAVISAGFVSGGGKVTLAGPSEFVNSAAVMQPIFAPTPIVREAVLQTYPEIAEALNRCLRVST